MMTKQRVLGTVAAIAACLALALSAGAYDFVQNGIYYNINGSNVSVTYKTTSYNSYSGTVNIPATVTNGGTTYNVTSIGPSAFLNCTNLSRVVIPNSVTYLMNDAFKGCSKLTNITIPATVYAIYNNVFDGCTALKSVICLNPTPKSWNTNNFSSTTYTNAKLIVPQGSLSAYQSSTYCWGSFTSIQEMDCDFAEDAIFYDILDDNQVEVTHALRFADSYSGDVAIPTTVTHNGSTYTVTSIGLEAFYSDLSLYSVSVPATVNNISNYAFYDCRDLTGVNIPDGITDINYCTFGSCYSLPNIVIPSSITWIAQNAFRGCTSLTSITCRATTPPMCVDSSCFPSEAYSNATLYVPSSAVSDYQSESIWENFNNIVGQDYDFVYNGIYYRITGANTAEVTFKDKNYNSYSGAVNVPSTVMHNGITYTVTAVGRLAFYKCTGLTSVSLPSTIKTIDYGAFCQCTALTSLTIPSGVTTLGEFCFMNCSSLATISLPNGITSIPRQCFTYCASLQSITIPGSVDEISYYAFYQCNNLESVTIQNGVKSILYSAFADCFALENVSIPASVTTIEESAFSGCQAMIAYYVNSGNTHYCSQDGVLYTADMNTLLAYPNMRGTSYQIPAGVDTIGNSAFKDCNNLHQVTLNDDLKTIADYAFWGCHQLTDIVIPASVDSVGVCSLSYCTSLRHITVDENNQNYMSVDDVLYTIDGKNLIQYPCARPDKHYSVLNTTENIWDRAFRSANCIKSVYLPTSLVTVGWQAFYESSMERLVIDEGLATIDQNAFAGCINLKSIHLPSTLTNIDTWAFQSDYELAEITFAGTTPPTVGTDAFFNVGIELDDPVTIYVPAGTSNAYASHDWNSKNSFTFSVSEISPLDSGTEFTVDSLIYVTTDASLNTKVSGVTSKNLYDPGIPPKVAYQGNLCTVTTLGYSSLQNCTKMVRAEVPFTVTWMDDYSFYGCTNIQKLRLHEGLKQMDPFSASHINALTTLTIPASTDSISGTFVNYSDGLSRILVENGNTKYTSIGGVLYSKDRKHLIAFPHALSTSYNVPSGTQVIGSSAFRGAAALEEINLPTSLKKIDSSAFFDNSSLTEIVVPKGVERIENNAFSKTGLTSAELPATLTFLGYNAFYNVTTLTSLTVKNPEPPTCGVYFNPRTGERSYPFIEQHYTQCTLYVPRGSKTAYQTADIWKNFQHIVEVDLPAEYIRGDVNDDGLVGMDDLTALINYLVFNDASGINLVNADATEDGVVGMDDLTTLINYLVFNTWPEPAPIDMWYLWGNFIGEIPWGDASGNNPIGVSALPLYPTGTFNAQGKGLLTWTGIIPRQYFTIVHSAGYYDDLASEVWMVDQNGNYLVTSIDEGENNGYSIFLLDAGYYTINLNTATMTLSIEPIEIDDLAFGSICMVGTFNNWSNTANPMETVNPNLGLSNSDWWVDTWTITQTNDYGDVKFCNYDDWNYNWGGDTFPYGCGMQDGVNIPATPGTYKVFFNDITGLYNFIKIE